MELCCALAAWLARHQGTLATVQHDLPLHLANCAVVSRGIKDTSPTPSRHEAETRGLQHLDPSNEPPRRPLWDEQEYERVYKAFSTLPTRVPHRIK